MVSEEPNSHARQFSSSAGIRVVSAPPMVTAAEAAGASTQTHSTAASTNAAARRTNRCRCFKSDLLLVSHVFYSVTQPAPAGKDWTFVFLLPDTKKPESCSLCRAALRQCFRLTAQGAAVLGRRSIFAAAGNSVLILFRKSAIIEMFFQNHDISRCVGMADDVDSKSASWFRVRF